MVTQVGTKTDRLPIKRIVVTNFQNYDQTGRKYIPHRPKRNLHLIKLYTKLYMLIYHKQMRLKLEA